MRGVGVAVLVFVSIVGYAILNDLVTAHLCVEYFTVGHPDIGLSEPIPLAFAWGFLASWWVALPAAVVLALAAAGGARPFVGWPRVRRFLLTAGLATAGLSAAAGLTGYLLARAGEIRLVGTLAENVPVEKHALFLADLWIHLTAYACAVLAVGLGAWALWRARAPRGPEGPSLP